MSTQKQTKLPGRIMDQAAAFEACREMIHGDGTDASIQRVIDLSRIALGYEPRGYHTGPYPTLPARA